MGMSGGIRAGRCVTVTALAAAAGALLATTPAAGRTPGPDGSPASARASTSIVLTKNTVTVSRATVKKNLVGVARDGSTFKFKRAAGALAKLRAGKVMLLQGSDAAVVTKVRRSGGRLLVTTKPAKITDVVQSGRLVSSGPPDFKKAFLAPTAAATASAAGATEFERPGFPYVGRPEPVLRARAADGTSFSAQGSAGPFGYSLTFTPVSNTRMNIAGVLCFQWGSICSNGPSNGVSAEVNVDGYIDAGQQDIGINIDGGRVTGTSIAIKHLNARAKMTYTIARGQGDAGQSPPVFRVPLGVDYAVPVYGIPMYFKLQTALLLKLGVSSKNAVIRGGADVSTTGSSTIAQGDAGGSTTGSDNQADVQVLDSTNGGTKGSISLAPSGTVVAVQFPKIGAGLGVRALNGIGYIDLVTSVGQTTGSAIAGMFCSSYDLFFTVGAGLEAQLGPFGVASPKKTLFEKSTKTAEPGCPLV